jgi:parallel beta-helix repeat protein
MTKPKLKYTNENTMTSCSFKNLSLKYPNLSLLALCLLAAMQALALPASGETHLVPGKYKTIQETIDHSKTGDIVLVKAGTYLERIRLGKGITVRSAGDSTKGKLGLMRAEATILDHPEGKGPGVTMAEGATLDGFTITGVGQYDEAKWKKHHATQGNMQSHDHIGQPGNPGIEARHDCIVTNNIVHHIGYTGIGITGTKDRKVSPRIIGNICYRNMGGGIGSMAGSTALIENNVCFENFYAGIGHNGASPIVRGNDCYRNIRAGIGISEGSCPTVTKNRCHDNLRAGIGIRTGEDTRPVVEDNDCFENRMAGIGTEEEARPIIRGNRCRNNKLAGIGSSHGARPEITGNECIGNGAAGIGVEDGAVAKIVGNLCKGNKSAGIGIRQHAEATVINNRILDNGSVAIGVRNGSKIIAEKNTLSRKGGMPPLVAILDNSQATLIDNDLSGGGVAGVLLQGNATVKNNRFHGNGPRKGGPPNFAIWVREGSEVTFSDNQVKGWRHALFASKAKQVTANDNQVRAFLGTALVIRESEKPATATGNRAFSDDPKAQAIEISGATATVTGNWVEKIPKK